MTKNKFLIQVAIEWMKFMPINGYEGDDDDEFSDILERKKEQVKQYYNFDYDLYYRVLDVVDMEELSPEQQELLDNYQETLESECDIVQKNCRNDIVKFLESLEV